MNAEAIRHFYDYHFATNRRIWDDYVTQLSDAQFTQPVGYAHGSVRDQLIHIMSVDEAWFGDLSGGDLVEPVDSAADGGADALPDRAAIRAHWDAVEQAMRAYLAALRDDMLTTKPLTGEDAELLLWQVLLHVVNHGTDHRAQVLRLLHDLGVETGWQDYIFYVYEHP